MKNKLIMCRWLPASGKTTRAKEMCQKHWYKRVNKDDLRSMVDNWNWSKSNEKKILQIRDNILLKYLLMWDTVIIDDTNYAPYHEETLKTLASDVNVKFEIKEFDTDVDECILRDSKRDNPVGKKVITDMYHKYVCKETIPNSDWNVVIFDIDWTLARMTWRSPYDYTLVHTDEVVTQVREVLYSLQQSWFTIVICTGRDWACEKETKQRLRDNEIMYDCFFMRKEWDTRNDMIVKKEMLDKIGKENVFAVFDDRPRVIRMWRDEWLFVFNVWSGREF